MADRTTYAEVVAIMDDCDKTELQVAPFIIAASLFITNVFSEDTTTGATTLAELEKWMAAHMLASTICRTASEEKVGEASVKYTGKWDINLKGTSYGQMVLVLDPSGLIAGNVGKQAATTFAIESFDS